MYNGIPFWTGVPVYDYVTGASRSMVYLRGTNQVAFYDRAATTNGLGMSVNQITTGPPTILGNTASWPTRSASQKAYLTNLLPSGATVVNNGLPCPDCTSGYQVWDWEPYAQLSINAPGTPLSTQFLSVLEWGPSSLTQTPTTLVQSNSGQNFDGSLIGSSLVMFMRNWPATFTGTTYPASGATTQYVSDLAPNTTYTISGAGAPASATTDTAGVLSFNASGRGNITITTGAATPYLESVTVAPSTSTLQALGTQQYSATCNYSDGSSTNCTSTATWASSSTGVVTVNSSGIATGVAQGSAQIIVTDGSVQGQAAVTVSAPALQSIAVTPGTQTVTVGGVQQFTATGTYNDSRTKDLTATVVWSSSNAAVAAAGSTGMATAMAAGTAKIIAASGGIQGLATLTVPAAAATPSFSPAAGTYTSTQTVTISTATPSATIYYTTNGSTPTTSSPVYSGPITVSATETLSAIAVATGDSSSAVGSAAYTITPPATTPSFSPAAGTYTSTQTVTISSATPSAKIYYTTNGSTPTTSSPVYSGPITVPASETIQAIAVATGDSSSAVGSAAYTITPTSGHAQL